LYCHLKKEDSISDRHCVMCNYSKIRSAAVCSTAEEDFTMWLASIVSATRFAVILGGRHVKDRIWVAEELFLLNVLASNSHRKLTCQSHKIYIQYELGQCFTHDEFCKDQKGKQNKHYLSINTKITAQFCKDQKGTRNRRQRQVTQKLNKNQWSTCKVIKRKRGMPTIKPNKTDGKMDDGW